MWMLIATQDINTRYAEGVGYLSNTTYNKFARALYGNQQPKNKQSDYKLVLLLYALNGWSNAEGAINSMTDAQMCSVMDNIARLQDDLDTIRVMSVDKPICYNNTISAFTLDVVDTASVDLTLQNSILSAVVKISPTVGNALQQLGNGLFVSNSGGGGGGLVLLKTGADFSTATRYDDVSLDGVQFQVWHRGLGFLIYDWSNPLNPANEFEVVVGGGFNITIPGFDVNAGDNYFYILT